MSMQWVPPFSERPGLVDVFAGSNGIGVCARTSVAVFPHPHPQSQAESAQRTSFLVVDSDHRLLIIHLFDTHTKTPLHARTRAFIDVITIANRHSVICACPPSLPHT